MSETYGVCCNGHGVRFTEIHKTVYLCPQCKVEHLSDDIINFVQYKDATHITNCVICGRPACTCTERPSGVAPPRSANKPEDIPHAAVKFDGDKIRLELLPAPGLYEVGRVFHHGAQKYEAFNWRKGFNWTRLIGACFRHIFAWLMREDNDPDSGLNHIAHACCCLLMLMDHIELDIGVDDRWKKETK